MKPNLAELGNFVIDAKDRLIKGYASGDLAAAQRIIKGEITDGDRERTQRRMFMEQYRVPTPLTPPSGFVPKFTPEQVEQGATDWALGIVEKEMIRKQKSSLRRST
ncbi:MAG TPA: hypothetical protein VLF68_01815 [Candidatus Saccharimonadales bacterium]|nr:hypothetical protein [Candidatus Saccharimonadales bacterium]